MESTSLEGFSQTAIHFLLSPPFDGWLGIVRIIFIVLGVAFILLTLFLTTKSNYLKWSYFEDMAEFATFRPHGVKKMVKAWEKIKSRLDTGLESEYKLAVIEADSLLDDILRRMSYGGENLGERLEKLTSATLPDIEEIKEGHKARTNILHNPDYTLSQDEASKILSAFEKALESIQAF
ncbi:MAG: hypothetical protein ABH831_02660 [Candidatus Nealsonbacteria bacterium]